MQTMSFRQELLLFIHGESKISWSRWSVPHLHCQVAAEVKGNRDLFRSTKVICLLKNDFK